MYPRDPKDAQELPVLGADRSPPLAEEAQLTQPPMGLWQEIREDWLAHGSDWTRPGFRAVAIHRFGNYRMRIKSKIVRAPLSLLYRALYRRARNVWGIELPYEAKIGRRVVFEHQHGIVVHGNVEIGDDCIIRQGVTIGNRTLEGRFDAPKLGKRVNVGAGAKILGAVTIGDDAAIGANAVVLSDVPDGALVVGIPARLASRAHKDAGA
jgi:serine O-acetyltransferase